MFIPDHDRGSVGFLTRLRGFLETKTAATLLDQTTRNPFRPLKIAQEALEPPRVVSGIPRPSIVAPSAFVHVHRGVQRYVTEGGDGVP